MARHRERGRATRIWESATGSHMGMLNGQSGRVTSAAISPDGSWIAVVSASRTLQIWERASSEIVALIRTEAALLDCAWTENGHDLIACSSRGLHGYRFLPSATTQTPAP
ncbi:WD40 repeat domain-containing protein [Streptomyces atratus]|uniref:WD40 repeat domain-containing protein n=1 Tax=Streptomyces atratus TaxID=1893 RepID=UPI0037983B44